MAKKTILMLLTATAMFAGCAAPPSLSPETSLSDETHFDGGSFYAAGTDLGWVDARFRIDADESVDAALSLTFEYDAPADWPTTVLVFHGADVFGQIEQEHMARARTRGASSNGSAEPGRLAMSGAGQHHEVGLPALPGVKSEVERAALPLTEEYHLQSIRDTCGLIVGPGEICHLFWVYVGGSPNARFEISSNWTGEAPTIAYGHAEDTFLFSMEDFRAAAGASYRVAGLEGDVGAGIRFDVELGRPDQNVLLAFYNGGTLGPFGTPVGEATYTTPGGDRRTVNRDAYGIEVSPVGGSWTFEVDSRTVPVREQYAMVWGAVVPANVSPAG